MLRRAACETASVRFPAAARVARPRAWGTARRRGSPFGVRRLLGFALAGSSRAVASLLRRAGADVCRLHVRSPGPWLGIPAHSLRLCAGMPAGSLCDAGLTRRAPGTRPPTLRHGPPGLAPDLRSDEGRRRRTGRRRDAARWSIALSLPFCLRFLTHVSLWPFGTGVCTRLRSTVSIRRSICLYYYICCCCQVFCLNRGLRGLMGCAPPVCPRLTLSLILSHRGRGDARSHHLPGHTPLASLRLLAPLSLSERGVGIGVLGVWGRGRGRIRV